MELFATALAQGWGQATSADALLFMLFGTVVGYVFGILPGLQSVTAMSVFLPLTYWWSPVQAMYFFAGVIGAAGNGGAVTAIVVNIPGTAQNAATMLEGYPLTRQGRAVFALNLSASASWLGAVFGVLVLLAFIPVFVPFLLSFGPAETFWVAVFGLVTMVLAITGNIAKGLVSVGLGVVLAIVGMGGPRLPVPRFTFGSSYLLDGFEIVVVVIGLLVLSECLLQMAPNFFRRWGDAAPHDRPPPVPPDWPRQMADGLMAPFRNLGIFMRSSALGTVIGALPGVGGTVAQFMSYNIAAATTARPEEIGKGAVDAMIATEAATNSKEGGALFPTLLFGIPGNAEMALVLAAWQIHGLEPGPMFLQNHGHLAWALIFGLLFANFVASAGTAAASPWLARLPSFDMAFLAPPVVAASLMSAFTVRANFIDFGALAVLGLYAYLQRLYGFSVIGTVVGFVLGDVIERSYYTALQSALGDHGVFLGSGVAIVLAILTGFALVWSLAKLARIRAVLGDGNAAPPAAGGLAIPWRLGSFWFNLATIALILWLGAEAWGARFRGGPVAGAVLALCLVLQLLALWQDLRRPPEAAGAAPDAFGRAQPANSAEARAFPRLALLLAATLLLALFAGHYVALGAFLVVFWAGIYRAPVGRSVALALLFGAALPWGFAQMTESSMWRGILPPLLPGFIGGEVMPVF
ncbi:MAG: tripartite tricarboxylate transporter permease [Alphaproteobacteria bacterium]|nr:tripartite tricarboxylate transporter permease [Alphaproteobacteria bacterium]